MPDKKRFDDPKRVAINRVYTKKGDAGTTSLVGGQQRPKYDPRIAAYGAVDELNAFVGAARQSLADELGGSPPSADVSKKAAEGYARLDATLRRVQHELFNLGSILATLPDDVHPSQPRVGARDIERLEEAMDRCNAELEPLRSFVLPGGSRLNTDLHVCRTVCRRAERVVTQLAAVESVDPEAIVYMNRLGDAFFVWSRWVIATSSGDEELWDPNVAA